MAIPTNFKSEVAITHITTATAIVDIDGVKFITDPIFDDAPQSHDRSQAIGLKPGEFFLTMQEGPAISIRQLLIIDCVLLSHEDHVDNLDETGRQLLIGRRVITSPDGAKNLSEYPGTCAIAPWQTLKFRLGGEEWSITGVPCVHVPGGEAMLPSPKSPSGFVQITMGGEDAVKMMELFEADMLVPMHFESWSHFTQGGKDLKDIFGSGGLGNKPKWLSSGKQVRII
ncbi:Zn-dependent hydrolase of the beta-lactamase fold [Fusarium napiforme]|uniref:Zn-dependent hydrolase of the beta-lactamase fold n=1 Tax=Fusarium napiforme TaxID=42672 RepID=A0A8H5N6F2_9HYPO|nr:Zn-dependent hydrolase of the beta-lactamase fold [Fusarium napiforme]